MKPKLLSTLSFFTLFAIAAHSQNYVTLYTDCDYKGRSQTFIPGRYTLYNSSVGSQSVSSLRVPSGLKLVLYTGNTPGTGQKMSYTSDVNCLRNLDWNDKAVSIVVQYDNGSNYNNNYNNNNNYGYGMVTLYKDCNYRGTSRTLSLGYHRAYDLGIGNDQLSSIRVPNGYYITIYEDDNYRGSHNTYYNDVSCLDRSWNDRVSSVYIGRGNSNTNNYNYNNNYYYNSGNRVELFEDCDFNGRSSSLTVGIHNLNTLGISNDALSSIRIPYGYSITLYMNDHMGGLHTTYTNNVKCLPHLWNDKVSSVWIKRTSF